MNGRFDTLQAAVVLAKFPHFDWEVEQRIKIGARYTELLAQRSEGNAPASAQRNTETPSIDICPPLVSPGNTHVYGQYTIRVKDRETLGLKLKEMGIPTAVYYPKCLHEQPAFAHCGYKWGDFPEAERASREVLSLPMHPFLSEEDQDTIIGTVKNGILAAV